jgi:hypothetical protein
VVAATGCSAGRRRFACAGARRGQEIWPKFRERLAKACCADSAYLGTERLPDMSSGTLFRSSPGRLETEPGTSRPLFASVGASVHGVAFGFIYESKRLKVGGGLIYR